MSERPARIPRCLSVLLLLLTGFVATSAIAGTLKIILPGHRLAPEQLAVVVNDSDPLSVRIGEYYREARQIPHDNLIHLRFPADRDSLNAETFVPLREVLFAATPERVQAYALAWARPYRVGCMSMTSAVSLGYDRSWCSEKRCDATRNSPYYGYTGSTPWRDLGIRPSINLAARNFQQAKALIDRGLASDGSLPGGTAYLLSTHDRHRNVRARDYSLVARLMSGWIDTSILRADTLKDRDDVLFYFTGLPRVEGLESLNFRPGAIADHLTSAGGILNGSRQMSAIEWLEAGATGSYGTVVEPCNHLGKFPEPRLLMESYGRGASLIESYWRSVQQPGEGIFIGEPLAAPFAGANLTRTPTGLRLTTRNLWPGSYRISHSINPIGPFEVFSRISIKPHQREFDLPDRGDGYYRVEPLESP
ncbi:MAG: TIGR03790 family protein [Candidatus Thiodiazotropha sp.]